jgi:excisionase family DNA binding protein
MAKPIYISTEQAAVLLGVSARWVRELIKRGELEGEKIGDRVLAVDMASVKRLEEARRAPAAQGAKVRDEQK